MTPGCHVWVDDLLRRERRIAGEVLEIGSLDVNGSIRSLFANRRRFPTYLGIDIRMGPGVDLQVDGDILPFPDARFQVVVMLETLEHDRSFWTTLSECHRVLASDGWLIVTTRAFGFPRHDYPHDYWRFTADGLRSAIRQAGFSYADAIEDEADGGVFALARREDGPVPRRPSVQPGLLSEDEVEALRRRMRAFIPIGITSVADAFERIDSDRRFVLEVLEKVDADAGGTLSQDVKDLIARVLKNHRSWRSNEGEDRL